MGKLLRRNMIAVIVPDVEPNMDQAEVKHFKRVLHDLPETISPRPDAFS